jgi:hypothetical protein
VSLDVHQRFGDTDASAEQLHATPAKPEHLAQAEPIEATEEDERPVPRLDRISQTPQLLGGKKAHLSALDLRERELGDGVYWISRSSTAALTH